MWTVVFQAAPPQTGLGSFRSDLSSILNIVLGPRKLSKLSETIDALTYFIVSKYGNTVGLL